MCSNSTGKTQREIRDILSKGIACVQEPSLVLPHLGRWKYFSRLNKSFRLPNITLSEVSVCQPKIRLKIL